MPIAYGGDNITFADGSKTTSAYTGFKNRIINGGMVFDQRGSASSPVNSGSDTYFVDRWCMFATAGGIFNGRQSSIAPTGFTNSALFTSTAASSPAAGNATGFRQKIEGFNVADLMWGTANAQTVTLSFWVRSSTTGTYSVSLFNADSSGPNRSYVATYTVNSANTFEYKTITIPGETSGTWNTTNGQGIQVWWDLGSGSGLSGTAGAWNSSLAIRSSGSTNWSGTNGATFYITGVQLEVGSSASTFDFRSYGMEEMLCKRYFQTTRGTTSSMIGTTGYVPSGINQVYRVGYELPVTMRTTPSVTLVNLSAWDGTAIVSLNSIVSNFCDPNRVDGDWSVNAGLNASRIVRIYQSAGGTSRLDISAEL